VEVVVVHPWHWVGVVVVVVIIVVVFETEVEGCAELVTTFEWQIGVMSCRA
jgi:hypothetical protein